MSDPVHRDTEPCPDPWSVHPAPDPRVADLEAALRGVLDTIDMREHRSAAHQHALWAARQALRGDRR